MYDHKAFTFWAERDLLAIPVNLYEHIYAPESPWDYGTNTFNGVYVYEITSQNGFSMLGRIPLAPDWWSRGLFIADSIFAIDADEVKNVQINAIDSGIDPPDNPE